jgi:5'-phosphate synthase pdxT subunit
MILLAKELRDGQPDQHQLGALDIVVRRNAFGRQMDSFEEDLDFAGVQGQPVRSVFTRAPWVESAADHADVLARVPDTAVAGVAAGRIVAIRQGGYWPPRSIRSSPVKAGCTSCSCR